MSNLITLALVVNEYLTCAQYKVLWVREYSRCQDGAPCADSLNMGMLVQGYAGGKVMVDANKGNLVTL